MVSKLELLKRYQERVLILELLSDVGVLDLIAFLLAMARQV